MIIVFRKLRSMVSGKALFGSRSYRMVNAVIRDLSSQSGASEANVETVQMNAPKGLAFSPTFSRHGPGECCHRELHRHLFGDLRNSQRQRRKNRRVPVDDDSGNLCVPRQDRTDPGNEDMEFRHEISQKSCSLIVGDFAVVRDQARRELDVGLWGVHLW